MENKINKKTMSKGVINKEVVNNGVENKKTITKETTLAEVLAKKGAEEVLAKYKVPCLTCPMAKFEMEELTLGQICQMYGINSDELLKELNGK